MAERELEDQEDHVEGFEIFDVDVHTVGLVGKGANDREFLLLKSHKGADDKEVEELEKGKLLAKFLNLKIKQVMEKEGVSRADVVGRLVEASGLKRDTINAVLDNTIGRPPNQRLLQFATVLKVPFETMRAVADADRRGEPRSLEEDLNKTEIEKANWKVGADRNLSIATRESWDGSGAKARIFTWAGWPENPQPSKARRAFLLYDASEPELKGSYKDPFADVVNGNLVAISAGLRAAASRLPQTDAPSDVLAKARTVIDGYQAKMKKSLEPNNEEVNMSDELEKDKNLEVEEVDVSELVQKELEEKGESWFKKTFATFFKLETDQDEDVIATKPVKVTTDATLEVVKSVYESRISEIEKKAQEERDSLLKAVGEIQTQLDSEKERRAKMEWLEKAEGVNALPVKQKDLATKLYDLEKSTDTETAEYFLSLLKTASEKIVDSGMFAEFGTTRYTDDQLTALEKAKELVEKGEFENPKDAILSMTKEDQLKLVGQFGK